MKFIIALLFSVIFCEISLGQRTQLDNESKIKDVATYKDTIYIDENDQFIDKRLFNYKSDTKVYSALLYDNDSIYIKRLRYSHFMGRLDDSLKGQIFKLIASRNGVDTLNIMVFHYLDTLKRVSDYPKKKYLEYNKDSSYHYHRKDYKTFLRIHKNCLKRFNKLETTNVYHLFNYNRGHPLQIKKLRWSKDNYGLVSKIFRDNYKRFNTVIIHPSGQYYCLNYFDNSKAERRNRSRDIYQDIIKGKNWDKHYRDFNSTVESLNSM